MELLFPSASVSIVWIVLFNLQQTAFTDEDPFLGMLVLNAVHGGEVFLANVAIFNSHEILFFVLSNFNRLLFAAILRR